MQPHTSTGTTSPSTVADQQQESRFILYIGHFARKLHSKMLERDFLGINIASSFKSFLWLEKLARSMSVHSDHGVEMSRFPDAIICDLHLPDGDAFGLFKQLKTLTALRDIPFIIVAEAAPVVTLQQAMASGVDDFYVGKVDPDSLQTRIEFLKTYRFHDRSDRSDNEIEVFRIPLWKRMFDLAFASFLLLLMGPAMLLIALLIKLESKGKILYVSQRAGTGYRVFDFYKFRSMRDGAESELDRLLHLNQYQTQESGTLRIHEKCVNCLVKGVACENVIQILGNDICRHEWQKARDNADKKTSFIKLEDDPRITKVGKFLRNTSLDELPQLFNVLKGDMSIVGNRPLPLYEAEHLTTDQWSRRFLAPAGITGLWQVTRRGKADLSEEERKRLDAAYAGKARFWSDMKILFKTVPALFQRKSV